MIEVVGTVRQLQELQTFNKGLENEFNKKVLVLETLENKTPYKIEFTNKNIELLDGLLLGSNVLVSFDIVGNYDPKDNKKVYNSFIAKSLKQF